MVPPHQHADVLPPAGAPPQHKELLAALLDRRSHCRGVEHQLQPDSDLLLLFNNLLRRGHRHGVHVPDGVAAQRHGIRGPVDRGRVVGRLHLPRGHSVPFSSGQIQPPPQGGARSHQALRRPLVRHVHHLHSRPWSRHLLHNRLPEVRSLFDADHLRQLGLLQLLLLRVAGGLRAPERELPHRPEGLRAAVLLLPRRPPEPGVGAFREGRGDEDDVHDPRVVVPARRRRGPPPSKLFLAKGVSPERALVAVDVGALVKLSSCREVNFDLIKKK